MRDVILVIPGILGSVLERNGRPVWGVSSGNVFEALRTMFSNVQALRLPEGIGDGPPEDGVTAVRLIPDIRLPLGVWTFDTGYSELLQFLKSRLGLKDDPTQGPCNLIPFPYDWRLSNRYNGERLREVAEKALFRWRSQGPEFEDAKLVFVCHSMGGLVARWYVDCLGGAEHTRKLITMGTPHRGSLKALDQLVNGSKYGPGPFKVNLSELARSLPSLHQLLPEYACIEHEEALRKTTEMPLPVVESHMVHDAMNFHAQINAARANTADNYDLHPIGGYEQPTWTTARVKGSTVECVRTIGGNDEAGDGTVPRLSFTPKDLKTTSPGIHYVADNHGGLVHNSAVFNQIEGILTANDIVYMTKLTNLSAEIPEAVDPGGSLSVSAKTIGGVAPIEAVLTDLQGNLLAQPVRLLESDGALRATFDLPGPGGYQVTLQGADFCRGQVSPITGVVLAWPTEAQLDAK